MDEILYIITHDLRTGFRAVLTIPDFIEEDIFPLPEPRQSLLSEHLTMLRIQARRSESLLLSLRDYSRIGRCAEAISDHTVEEILTRANHLSPLPEGFSMTVSGGGTLTGPGNELAQLFAALLSNAVKHHDRDGGQIDIRITGAGPIRRVVFTDDGPGIPARFREVAFDMLRTLRPRDEVEGSGMGLVIARKIVTALGGEITVLDGGNARGTALAFTLPGQDAGQPLADRPVDGRDMH